jgi:hypothetical protein
MHIAVRIRRDFTVIDAERMLAAARRAYVELNPGSSERDAEDVVTSAADAIFTLLERDGVIGSASDAKLAERAEHGLEPGGWRAQVTTNEKLRLPAGPDCFHRGDVFALPVDRGGQRSSRISL